jgi:3-phenylpropionate/trans-cinnamate dioxygenase ferredoxin reductase component
MTAAVSTSIERIVVVGAGECGAATAVGLRSNGFQGAVTLLGDEVTAPYERPPLSKQMLTGAESTGAKIVLTAERCAALGISFVGDAKVRRIDGAERVAVLSDGEQIHYDRLVLTTGARVRPLAVPGGDVALMLRTIDDAIILRSRLQPGARVVVIGGGLIGLELAASATQLGCTVTVVEAAERAMARGVPARLAEILTARHAAEGVAVLCGASVEQVDTSGSTHVVVLTNGSTINCDLVVAGVGVVPNVELAAHAGLRIDNGIRVDAELRTSDPHIFAAGDCCSFPHRLFGGRRMRLETWRNAYDQAKVAAQTVLGRPAVYDAVPWFWSDQYDLGLQVAGMPDEADRSIVRTRRDGGVVEFGLAADGRIVSAAGLGPGTSVARDVRGAELLIANEIEPDPIALADPDVTLKSLATLHHAVR